MSEAPMNVLVPAAGISASSKLVEVAEALISGYGGTGTVLSVVEVPEDRSLSEGALVARRRRSLLHRVAQLHPDQPFGARVRTAHSLASGIRTSAVETHADLLLLGWHPTRRSGTSQSVDDLVSDPPCDLALVKGGKRGSVDSVLLPVRGGPHAALALRVAEAVSRRNNAELTLLHITVPHWDDARRKSEERFAREVREQVTYEKAKDLRIEADSVERTLLSVAAEHDLVVMGAAARDVTSPYLLGRIAHNLARTVDATVIVAKTREPVTGETFNLPQFEPAHPNVSHVVDRWFAENTYHSHEFKDVRYLVELKERQGRTISLALPTLNEEKTVGKILSTIKRHLIDRIPLIDQLVVIDSQSQDRTVQIAESLDVPVYQHPEILAPYGSFRGKGEGLWKSLCVTSGDIVCWVDSDITGFHPKFVYGLIGPLLTQPELGFVKGFYRRPLHLGNGQTSTTGGGRVTELTARPLFNLFFPGLSGLVQPLAGEMAGRRDVLESVPFFTGYGVETGLLIDILEGYGLGSIAQTDLEERIHRNQSLLSLSKMAFAIVQVVIQRLGDRNRLQLLEDVNTSMKLIHYSPAELFLEVQEVREHERPPIKTLPEYVARTVASGRIVPAEARQA